MTLIKWTAFHAQPALEPAKGDLFRFFRTFICGKDRFEKAQKGLITLIALFAHFNLGKEVIGEPAED
jgi:hypothetical protein